MFLFLVHGFVFAASMMTMRDHHKDRFREYINGPLVKLPSLCLAGVFWPSLAHS